MSRTTIILTSVLGAVAIGGGVYLWMNKDNLSNPLAKNTAATNTNTAAVINLNTNTVTANQNLSTTADLKGDKVLDNKVTVAGVDLHLSSSRKTTTYEGVTAPATQSYIVIYFDPIDSGNVPKVEQALLADAHLLVGGKQISLLGVKVATNVVKNDLGYVKFLVPSSTTNVVFEFGPAGSTQHVVLTF